MWGIYVDGLGWVIKHNGWNLFTRDRKKATLFTTREEAHFARPGHHHDMGGAGFIGRLVKVSS